MDIEWAKDGRSGELYLVQARPETVHTRRDAMVLERFRLDSRGAVLVKGRSVGEKIGQGAARVIRSSADLEQLQQGEVLVTEMTDPDWEPVMKRAAAVVTDRGGRTCHAAIVSRELGIPAIVGTGTGTSSIETGEFVTVSCAEGDEGFVYRGRLPIRVERTNLAALPRPRTQVMMNVANPAEAFSLSFLPNDGVGLARLEFIIGTHVRAHPMALLHPERISDPKQRREIERLTAGYADKGQYFVDRLAEGVAMIAAAFWPKDVIVRLSDFKTNEYAGLLGGAAFEPKEENPMLGFRGASRYYDPRYRDGFGLECRAMRKVRDVMGLENVKLMDRSAEPSRRSTCHNGDGRPRIGPGRGRSRDLRHVRNSEQRDVSGWIRRSVRRLLHWQQRPDAADPRSRSRFRAHCAPLRRAERCRQADDRSRDPRVSFGGPEDRHLWSGAE
jgi:pyruvate,water dikinase